MPSLAPALPQHGKRAVGLGFSARQLALNASQTEHQRREQRVAQIVHLHERLYDDPELQQMYRQLERDEEIHLPSGPARTPEEDRTERQMDKLLGLFQVAAYMYNHDLLRFDELDLIAYEYLTVHQHRIVQGYLRIVAASNERRQMKIRPVPDLLSVGDQLQEKYHYMPILPDWKL